MTTDPETLRRHFDADDQESALLRPPLAAEGIPADSPRSMSSASAGGSIERPETRRHLSTRWPTRRIPH